LRNRIPCRSNETAAPPLRNATCAHLNMCVFSTLTNWLSNPGNQVPSWPDCPDCNSPPPRYRETGDGADRKRVVERGAVIRLGLVIGRILGDPNSRRQLKRRWLIQAETRIAHKKATSSFRTSLILASTDSYSPRSWWRRNSYWSQKRARPAGSAKDVVDDILGHRIDAVRGNPVSGKWRPHVSRALRHGAVRVVDDY
jgi:hypothetical protein